MTLRLSTIVCAFLITLSSSTVSSAQPTLSGISLMRVSGRQPIGTFNDVAFERVWGTLSGTIVAGEKIDGLNNAFVYTAQYEIIAPVQLRSDETIVVEPENRGNQVVLGRINNFSAPGLIADVHYPEGFGNGFLFKHRISYARVQWQYGIADGVPKNAQGVGEAIVRDFGRALASRFRTRILAGISQSAWYVETFVAEGFNDAPGNHQAVYDGAISYGGAGNWLAINQLAKANHTPQQPYLDPKNPRPLDPHKLLTRPATDPFFVEVAAYTDFYRLHASVTDKPDLPENMRRYDWPSPHAVGTRASSDNAFASMKCNKGEPVWLNPIPNDAYFRALVLELAHKLGSASVTNVPALPPTTLFKLGPAPTETANFNPLEGVTLEVPLVDADAQPEGGVRFPEVDAPIGKPVPVSLNPVITTTIKNTCGNLGEWQPIWGDELARRYGSKEKYVERYGAALDKLIAHGYVLSEDRATLLAQAARLYATPSGY